MPSHDADDPVRLRRIEPACIHTYIHAVSFATRVLELHADLDILRTVHCPPGVIAARAESAGRMFLPERWKRLYGDRRQGGERVSEYSTSYIDKHPGDTLFSVM
jgi:hypothetical protein